MGFRIMVVMVLRQRAEVPTAYVHFLALALDKQARFGRNIQTSDTNGEKCLRHIDQYSEKSNLQRLDFKVSRLQCIDRRGINSENEYVVLPISRHPPYQQHPPQQSPQNELSSQPRTRPASEQWNKASRLKQGLQYGFMPQARPGATTEGQRLVHLQKYTHKHAYTHVHTHYK